MSEALIATRMREIFGKDGWCQYPGDPWRGPACIAYAFFRAVSPEKFLTNLEQEQIYDLLDWIIGGCTPVWNDASGRTFSDILKIVDEIGRMEIAGELG